MKKYLFSLCSVFIIVAILFSMAGCGNNSQTVVESEIVEWVDDNSGNSNSTTVNSKDSSTITDSKNNGSTNKDNNNNNNNKGQTPVSAGSNVPEKLRGTTVIIGSWNTLDSVTGATEVVKKFENETGIKVKWVTMDVDNYGTQIAAKIAGKKDIPDVIRVRNYKEIIAGLCVPVSTAGYDFTTSEWDKRISDFYTVNGKVYAVNLRDTLMQQPKTLLYNTKLISSNDLEDPYKIWKKNPKSWTFEKFLEICRDYKKATNQTPWTPYNGYDICDMYNQSVAVFDGKKFTSNVNNALYKKGFETIAKLREEGIIGNTYFDRTGFEAGKVLFFTESPIGARTPHYYFKPLKTTGTLKAVPMPSIDGSANKQQFAEAEAYAFVNGGKNALGAAYFLRYYLDAKNYNENTFFADKTILDVYKACMKTDSFYFNHSGNVLDSGVSGISHFGFSAILMNEPSAQVTIKIDEYVPKVNDACNTVNNKLSKLK